MRTLANQTENSTSTEILIVSREDVVVRPFPHLLKDGFIAPALYSRLKAEFPPDEFFSRNTSVGGRAGRDLYRGDALYDQLLKESPAWREFYEFINSPAYISLALELFGENFDRFECNVDRGRARFVDYIEPREILANKSRLGRAIESVTNLMAGTKHKDDLFVRLDIAQGAVGYGKAVHCDRPNRLTSMIVYFCDAREIGLEGGELLLHEHLDKRPYGEYERYPKPEKTRTIAKVTASENRGLFFLCSNNSYHSVTAVKAQKSYRNFIYVSITGQAPSVW